MMGSDEPTSWVHSEDVREACAILAYVHEAMMALDNSTALLSRTATRSLTRIPSIDDLVSDCLQGCGNINANRLGGVEVQR
jgi:hypothetical protein